MRRFLGSPLREPLADPLGEPLGTSLRHVLLGEVALVFVAFYHRLQRAASRLIQGIVHEVVVELDPFIVELPDGGQNCGGDRRSLLGFAVGQRGKHAKLGAPGRFLEVRHDRNGGAASTGGRRTKPETPVSIGSAHHPATAGSGATTRRAAGQPWTARATVT